VEKGLQPDDISADVHSETGPATRMYLPSGRRTGRIKIRSKNLLARKASRAGINLQNRRKSMSKEFFCSSLALRFIQHFFSLLFMEK
jgi:hypothetical protein